jgi:endonuclease-3
MKEATTILTRLRAFNPYPTTELLYHSRFQLLMAVILSAQATDVSVNRATERLFAVAPTAPALLALGVEGLIPYLRHIGLFRQKATHLIATCERLIACHGGEVPRTRAELEALPGVGRKTANVVLNTFDAKPTLAVDTHVLRLAHRLGWSQGKTPEAVEEDLYAIIPPALLQNAHHWLILHGRYVCQARTPKCARCPIKDLCDCYLNKTE